MASIQGQFAYGGEYGPGARGTFLIRLLHLDGTEVARTRVGYRASFEFRDTPPGRYLIAASEPLAEAVKAVQVAGDQPFDAGLIIVGGGELHLNPGAPPVLTVCEALDRRDTLAWLPQLVVVGVFKSGMDETLRLDCPNELVSSDIGWPSSIGLTNVQPPPEDLRDQIEKKRQQILKAAPPEAPLRPERVVGLYGKFVALEGLTSAKCCSSQIQTSLPPARLFGVNETDLRVIR